MTPKSKGRRAKPDPRDVLAFQLLVLAQELLDAEARQNIDEVIAKVEQRFPNGWRPKAKMRRPALPSNPQERKVDQLLRGYKENQLLFQRAAASDPLEEASDQHFRPLMIVTPKEARQKGRKAKPKKRRS